MVRTLGQYFTNSQDDLRLGSSVSMAFVFIVCQELWTPVSYCLAKRVKSTVTGAPPFPGIRTSDRGIGWRSHWVTQEWPTWLNLLSFKNIGLNFVQADLGQTRMARAMKCPNVLQEMGICSKGLFQKLHLTAKLLPSSTTICPPCNRNPGPRAHKYVRALYHALSRAQPGTGMGPGPSWGSRSELGDNYELISTFFKTSSSTIKLKIVNVLEGLVCFSWFDMLSCRSPNWAIDSYWCVLGIPFLAHGRKWPRKPNNISSALMGLEHFSRTRNLDQKRVQLPYTVISTGMSQGACFWLLMILDILI